MKKGRAAGTARPEDRGPVQRTPTNPNLQRPAHAGRPWIEEVRDRGPVEVGQAFGLEHGDRGPGFLQPCPSCGAAKRHPSRRDRRGAVGLTPDGGGWRCHECDAHGDAVALAAWLSVGKVPGAGDPAWREVRRSCAAHGLCDPDPRDPLHGAPVAARRPPPAPRPPEPPRRLDAGEVRATWGLCLAVEADPEVAAWLAARGLSSAVVAHLDLARALPLAGPALPGWLRYEGRSWRESSHRLVVPLYGSTGLVESLHARALRPQAPKDKAASPAGAEVRGLVMADAAGRAMLAGQLAPSRVVVAEGVPDFLTWGTWAGDLTDASTAVLGVISGSWDDALAARVPDGAQVAVRAHRDSTGAKYADRIASTLSARCAVYRFPPESP